MTMEVTLKVGMNLDKMAGCQKDRDGSYQFEQKYEGMKIDDICNKRGCCAMRLHK